VIKPTFTNEKQFSSKLKDQIYSDWCDLIHSGFEKRHMTRPLWHFLIAQCQFHGLVSPELFWEAYFDQTFLPFARFVNQFGRSDHPGVLMNHDGWLTLGSAADLKRAMCDEMAQHYQRLMHILGQVSRVIYERNRDRETEEILKFAIADNPELNDSIDSLRLEYRANYERLWPYEKILWDYEVNDVLRDAFVYQAVETEENRPAEEEVISETQPIKQTAFFDLFRNAPTTTQADEKVLGETALLQRLSDENQKDPYFQALRRRTAEQDKGKKVDAGIETITEVRYDDKTP
jgi:hypothetical protein